MTRFKSSFPLMAVAAVAVAMFGAPNRADAAFKIRVSEDGGGTWTEVTDGGGGDLASATAGAITVFYSTAKVMFSVNVAQSKPLFGNTSGYSAMDLSITGTFGTGGEVIVDITDTDWNAPNNFLGPGILAVTQVGQGSPGLLTHTTQGWLNSDDPGIAGAQGNKEYGGVDATDGIVYATGVATPGSPYSPVNVPLVSGPYSMTLRTTFSGNANAGFSLDDKITFTPAPASLMMAAMGLPMLGVGAWFRRRKTVAPVV